jgi:N,N'-diacetyllegionaminate synthase
LNNKIFIIAEAGVNHNGDINIAKQLIDAAKIAGADAVKFQTFKAEKVISVNAPKAAYQKAVTGESESQLEMVKKLELDYDTHLNLMAYCREKKILFLSTPFDLDSIDLLNKLELPLFKIPSGEITNLPFLRKIGNLGKPIIFSTGMCSLGEIEDALNILEEAGTKRDNITVLHCTTQYPTPYKDVNLSAMTTIQNAFKINTGYSDHTLGIEIPIAAAALGAKVIEKHFTMDKAMEGPDHKASLEPDELLAMIKSIRNIELAMGDGIKRIQKSEKDNLLIARKSIVASQDIKKGELFTVDNLTVKRPGGGISPMQWDDVIGQSAKKDYQQDSLI